MITSLDNRGAAVLARVSGSAGASAFRWAGSGFWAIADQALFALASAATNLVLARWLTPAEYGAFAVAYAVFLLLGAIHTALITEPMLVFVAGKFAHARADYLRILRGFHWRLSGALSLVTLAAAATCAIASNAAAARSLLAIGLSAPLLLLTWLARRSAYGIGQPILAAGSSLLYLLTMISGLTVIWYSHSLSASAGVMSMALAGGVSGFWLLRRITRHTHGADHTLAADAVRAEHLRYGRWSILSSLMMWVPLNFYFIALSVWASLEISAALKALTNLVLPLLQANAALAVLVTPILVARLQRHADISSMLRRLLALGAAAGIAYGLGLVLFGNFLVQRLYGGKYTGQFWLFVIIAIVPALDGVIGVLASSLRATEQPRTVFRAFFCGALTVLLLGTLASRTWGLRGAAASMALASIVTALALAYSVVRTFADRGESKANQFLAGTL